MTGLKKDGREMAEAIRVALDESRLDPTAVDYVNAHGSGTKQNDRHETAAFKRSLGEHAYRVPVSSSKSMLGHLIAAAGVVELVIAVMALRKGVIPPTINYQTPDPECDLDYVPNQAREARFRHVLSNSFGFGGQNVSLVASTFRD